MAPHKFVRSKKRYQAISARLRSLSNVDGQVPFGTFAQVAREFAPITRARIRQIAEEIGVSIVGAK